MRCRQKSRRFRPFDDPSIANRLGGALRHAVHYTGAMRGGEMRLGTTRIGFEGTARPDGVVDGAATAGPAMVLGSRNEGSREHGSGTYAASRAVVHARSIDPSTQDRRSAGSVLETAVSTELDVSSQQAQPKSIR